MDQHPKRRKTDQLTNPVTWLPTAKGLIVLIILVVSLWGNASSFDATELRVIRDVAIAIVLGTGAQKVIEKWLEGK